MPFVKPAHKPLEEDKLLLEEDKLLLEEDELLLEEDKLLLEEDKLLLEEELPSTELEDWSSPAELDDGSPVELEDCVSSSLSLEQEKNVNDVAIMTAMTGMGIVLFILFFLF